MKKDNEIRILKIALEAIVSEAREPIIKVYAQSALDQTKPYKPDAPKNAYCKKHNWFGLHNEKCPLCNV